MHQETCKKVNQKRSKTRKKHVDLKESLFNEALICKSHDKNLCTPTQRGKGGTHGSGWIEEGDRPHLDRVGDNQQ